jgi:hypothetical protein
MPAVHVIYLFKELCAAKHVERGFGRCQYQA